ncbi:hypothetical protein AKJ16_DCAP04550 [Drosera capensis]
MGFEACILGWSSLLGIGVLWFIGFCGRRSCEIGHWLVADLICFWDSVDGFCSFRFGDWNLRKASSFGDPRSGLRGACLIMNLVLFVYSGLSFLAVGFEVDLVLEVFVFVMIVNWFHFNVYCDDCIDVLAVLSIFCDRMKWICSIKAKHEITIWLWDPCSYSGIHFCRLVVRNRFDLCSDVGVDVFSCASEILLLVVDLICFMSSAVDGEYTFVILIGILVPLGAEAT